MRKYLLLLIISLFISAGCSEQNDTVNNYYYSNENELWLPLDGPSRVFIKDMKINDRGELFVSAIDSSAKQKALIYLSSDNGSTWKNLTANLPCLSDNVTLNDRFEIIALDTITKNYLRSTDLGNSWETIFKWEYPYYTFINIDSRKNVFSLFNHFNGTWNYSLYKKQDTGSWITLTDSMRNDNNGNTYILSYYLYIDNKDNLYFVNRENSYTYNINFSSDCGASWKVIYKCGFSSRLPDIIQDNKGNIYISDKYTNNFAKTSDYGKTWNIFSREGIWGDDGYNLAVGPRGNLYLYNSYGIIRSKDDGRTWKQFIRTDNITKVCIDGWGYLFAVKDNSAIYKTKNPVE